MNEVAGLSEEVAGKKGTTKEAEQCSWLTGNHKCIAEGFRLQRGQHCSGSVQAAECHANPRRDVAGCGHRSRQMYHTAFRPGETPFTCIAYFIPSEALLCEKSVFRRSRDQDDLAILQCLIPTCKRSCPCCVFSSTVKCLVMLAFSIMTGPCVNFLGHTLPA